MGKTTKKYPWGYYRRFRNRRQALQARYDNPPIRKGAIPPDSWDDIYHDRQAWQPSKLAWRMFEAGESYEAISKFLRRKNYSYLEIRDITDSMRRIEESRVRWGLPRRRYCQQETDTLV